MDLNVLQPMTSIGIYFFTPKLNIFQKKNGLFFESFENSKNLYFRDIFSIFLFIFFFLLTGPLLCQLIGQDPLLANPQWIFPNLEQRYVILRSIDQFM